MNPIVVVEWVATVLGGLAIGSFLNVLIVRVGDYRRFLVPARSVCPECGAELLARDNIPLLSYLLLRGRCRSCGVRIPLFYPVVEALGALVAVAAVGAFGFDLAGLAAAVIGWLLVVIGVSDWRRMEIPLRFPIAGVTAAVAWAGYAEGGRVALAALLSAGVVAGIVGAVTWLIGRAVRREVVGFADLVVLGFLGALLGVGGSVVAVIYAGVGAVGFFAALAAPRAARGWVAGAMLTGIVALTLAGGRAAMVGQVLVLVAGFVAYRSGRSDGAVLPFGTWLCAGAVLAMTTADPLARWLDVRLPWRALLGAPSFFHVSVLS